jgi:dehydrogenase/reductase SDR family protein 12
MLRFFAEMLDPLLNETVILGYDRFGYHVRKPLWQPQDTQGWMGGKVVLITGANSGIGLATAEAVARKGATVILACRNAERGAQAQADLTRLTGNQDLHLELLDTSSLVSVRDFCARIAARWPRVDILVHNAGALLNCRQESVDGLEMTLAGNLLGPFLMTHLLRPLLAAAAPSRVIFVASGGMYLARLHPDDLQFQQRPYKGALAYAEAKRGMVVLNEIWAHELAEQGIYLNAMHPGWADTPGVQKSLPAFRALTRLTLRSYAEGADTIVWLAMKPDFKAYGQFWFDRRARAVHRMAATRNSPEEIRRYWELLCVLTGVDAPFPVQGTKQ